MKKLHKFLKEENGNAMILAAGGLTIAIMFLALVTDLGMFYSNYRKLKAAADFVDEEVQQMIPYYAYADDYATAFHNALYKSVGDMGYPTSVIVDYKITRQTFVSGNWNILVSTEIELKDEYQCIFLGIIGINEFPIHAKSKKNQYFPTEEPYRPGMPFEEW